MSQKRVSIFSFLLHSFLYVSLASAAVTPTFKDYFFRFTHSNPPREVLTYQRLRGNFTNTPGVTPAPHNPQDHFNRISLYNAEPEPHGPLYVVPTNPHPPPVPGYYGLSARAGIPDAWQLIYTYRLEEEQSFGFRYEDWRLKRSKCKPTLKIWYGPEQDVEDGWRWYAVKGVSPMTGFEQWTAWWVKLSDANEGAFADTEIVPVGLELVEAGPVNSNAPGGVEE